jgi:hypothetical protein
MDSASTTDTRFSLSYASPAPAQPSPEDGAIFFKNRRLEMPTSEFLEACRTVLGSDDPETVLAVLTSHDDELISQLISAHDKIVAATVQ